MLVYIVYLRVCTFLCSEYFLYVPLFTYLVFTRRPGESYRRRLMNYVLDSSQREIKAVVRSHTGLLILTELHLLTVASGLGSNSSKLDFR